MLDTSATAAPLSEGCARSSSGNTESSTKGEMGRPATLLALGSLRLCAGRVHRRLTQEQNDAMKRGSLSQSPSDVFTSCKGASVLTTRANTSWLAGPFFFFLSFFLIQTVIGDERCCSPAALEAWSHGATCKQHIFYFFPFQR